MINTINNKYNFSLTDKFMNFYQALCQYIKDMNKNTDDISTFYFQRYVDGIGTVASFYGNNSSDLLNSKASLSSYLNLDSGISGWINFKDGTKIIRNSDYGNDLKFEYVTINNCTHIIDIEINNKKEHSEMNYEELLGYSIHRKELKDRWKRNNSISENESSVPFTATNLTKIFEEHIRNLDKGILSYLSFNVNMYQNKLVIKSNDPQILVDISKTLKSNRIKNDSRLYDYIVEDVPEKIFSMSGYYYILKIPLSPIKNKLEFKNYNFIYSPKETNLAKKITPEIITNLINEEVNSLHCKYENIDVSSYTIGNFLLINSNNKELLSNIGTALYSKKFSENINDLIRSNIVIHVTEHGNTLEIPLSVKGLEIFKDYRYSIKSQAIKNLSTILNI